MPAFSPRKQVLLELEEFCRQALDSEYGVRVITNNPDRIKSEFYLLRKNLSELGDESFSGLTLRKPQSESDSIWIIPKAILESE